PPADRHPQHPVARAPGFLHPIMKTRFLFCAVALACGVPAGADSWPQWRGPDGQGHAPDAHDLPVTWSETENVAWKTPLPGRGWSSPVIAGNRIWLTTAVETPLTAEEKERRLACQKLAGQLAISGPVVFRALCVDLATGRLLHDVELFRAESPAPIHSLNSYASPSPVLADDRLFCHFGAYGTACVDTATAQVAWTNRDLVVNHENGPGSSPVLWRDRLVLTLDGSDIQEIAALDPATGRVAWKTPRSGELRADPDQKKAYGTPLVVPLGSRDVLLSPSADWLYGYDPDTGRELWRLNYGVLGYSVVPRPVVAHGLAFFSTSFNQPELLAVRLGDGTAAPEIAWREKKGVPSKPSMLVVGDELFMVSDKGVATCLDARTGEPRWTERLGGNVSSSPLFADGRVYVGNHEGQTYVFRPGTTFELLATNPLDGQIMATPAALGRALYLRTDQALYRIEKPDGAGKGGP
ncbi:MAG: PQQ-binding-like beta-propeller repeat protein, partial [Planctomycetaceae bacterium]